MKLGVIHVNNKYIVAFAFILHTAVCVGWIMHIFIICNFLELKYICYCNIMST